MPSTPQLSKLPFDYRESVKLTALIVGLVLLFFGVYMGGPWYVVAPAGAFAETAITADIYFKLVALLHTIAGAGMVYSAFRNHNYWTRSATVLGMSMFSLMVVTRLLSIGLVPTIWVLQLGLMAIAAILALTAESDR